MLHENSFNQLLKKVMLKIMGMNEVLFLKKFLKKYINIFNKDI